MSSDKILTSETQPPELPGFGSYWERSTDPFDPITILAALAQATNKPVDELESLRDKPPVLGWMLIDWCENPIGFVADGSNAGNPQTFEITQDDKGNTHARLKG